MSYDDWKLASPEDCLSEDQLERHAALGARLAQWDAIADQLRRAEREGLLSHRGAPAVEIDRDEDIVIRCRPQRDPARVADALEVIAGLMRSA